MSDYEMQYAAAQSRTARFAARGLTWEAAALAQQIRWNAARRAEYHYPDGMDVGATCCCHLCIDDPNFEDANVAFCLMQAAQSEHPDCLRLALLLACASFTQRRKIHALAWSDLEEE